MHKNIKVPLMDLTWQAAQVWGQVQPQWERAVLGAEFILGHDVETFEDSFASYSNAGFCVGVGNGTDALELAIRSLGIGPGDEVLVPVNSFIASALAVTRAGAKPVFVDCEPGTWLIDVAQIEPLITSKTRAIMPVHLYGQMADMKVISEIASRHGIFVVEDVAQAQGAQQDNLFAGAAGDVSGTSFYPGKNLGAFGDAGAVLTNNENIYSRLVALRNYGSPVKYHHPTIGFNSRLDPIQAIVLSEKLKHLDSWNDMRTDIASRYLRELEGIRGLGLPVIPMGNKHVWHLFVVTHEARSTIVSEMEKREISLGIHYPNPIHKLGAYRDLGFNDGDFPTAELLANRCFSLPIFPGMSKVQQDWVISSLREVIANIE